MYEKFKKLLDSRGVTPYRVSKDTGLSTATLSDWKNGKAFRKEIRLKRYASILMFLHLIFMRIRMMEIMISII